MALDFRKLNKNTPSRRRQLFSSSGIFALLLGLCLSFGPQAVNAENADSFLRAKMAVASPNGAKNLCTSYNWACAVSGAEKKLTQLDMKSIRNVNRRVNRQIRAVTDLSQYKRADFWTLPYSRRGDCEDFALLKKRELIRTGIAPQRLLLATVLDRRGNSHAVLIFRGNTGDYVLDNLNNKMKPWQSTRYTFLSMQSPANPRRWIGLLIKA